MRAEVAWGQIQGARETQQDTVACLSWANGAHLLLLADGMGGHCGGAVASGAVVESFKESYTELTSLVAPQRLKAALELSNAELLYRVKADPELSGMGTTLVAATLSGRDLWWVSVGDSALWLVREQQIRRLNADHSVGAWLDQRAESGQISFEEAAAAPQRSQLLEALQGEEIRLMDAPPEPFRLRPKDSLLIASDGVETCGRDALCRIAGSTDGDSSQIVEAILEAVEAEGRPGQDNASVILVRLDEVAAEG